MIRYLWILLNTIECLQLIKNQGFTSAFVSPSITLSNTFHYKFQNSQSYFYPKPVELRRHDFVHVNLAVSNDDMNDISVGGQHLHDLNEAEAGKSLNISDDVDKDDKRFSYYGLFYNVKNKFESTVRKVTGNPEYKFGDITMNVTKVAVNVTEHQIRSFTGNEEYKFGDLTRKALFESDAALTKFVDDYYQGIPSNLLPRLFEDFSSDRKSAMIMSLQLIAFVGLTLHFVLNLTHSFNILVSWGYTNMKTKALTAITSSVRWDMFLRTKQTLQLIVGPIFLPAQVGLTFFLCPKYRDVVVSIEKRLPLRKKLSVLNRCLALILSWIFLNCVSLALMTFAGCKALDLVMMR